MNWRRGILLAAINLAVALPPIIWLESVDAVFVRDHEHQGVERAIAAPGQPLDTAAGVPTFDPCHWIDAYTVEQSAVALANAPAEVLAGWRDSCPAHWTLSGMLHAGTGCWAPTASTISAQRKADIGFLLLIALQWFLVGGFPLKHSARPWREPGMFITICASLSVAVVFIRPLDDLARLFAVCAAFAWFWWVGLLVWKFARFGRKWTAQLLAAKTI